ncbi:MAG: flagellar biosynthesis/type III secretory pathway protein FliH [Chlamydiales bacterium]|jgi:flagellar biosynthesis/type III secretory pathway protein FliH
MPRNTVLLHAPVRAGRISHSSLDDLAQNLQQAAEADSESGDSSAANAFASSASVAQVEALLATLTERAEAIDAVHQKIEADLPEFAIQLAVGIAREILRTELGAGNYDVEAIVRNALAVAATGRSACVIHLHPDDLESCDPSRFRSNTRFEADPDIARGDVHVTTPQGLLVRDVDAALTRVREELLEAAR